MSTNKYNSKSPAVKRILQEAKELQLDPCPDYHAQPLEDNIFEWHFTIRGADGTEFEGGRYHGRILLPNDYPFQPPNLMLLTPNGRFELNKKICLSITGYHPEFWQPAWGIRTVLLGIMGFFPTKANGAIGGIDYTETERKLLAKQSRTWKCVKCDDCNIDVLPDQIERPFKDATEGNWLGGASGGDMPQFNFAYEGEKQKASETTAAGSRTTEHKQFNPLGGELPTRKISVTLALQEGRSSTASPSSPSSTSEPEPESLSSTFRPAPPLPTPTSLARDLRPQHQHNHAPPIWIDIVIFGLFAVLAGLLAKKFMD